MQTIMAKKSQGRPKKTTVPIQIRVVPELAKVLQDYADEQRHERSQEIILILEEKMRAAGKWPPPLRAKAKKQEDE